MATSRPPNLLFLFTDEQRPDTMACYGNCVIRTPTLNALARESLVFENAYVSQPVCTPSRSTIMTGLWPHTTGCTANNIPLKPDARSIGEMVSGEYVRGYYGKWHLGDEVIPQHGFDRWLSIEDMYRPYYREDRYLDRLSDYHNFLVDGGYAPDARSQGARVFSRRFAAKLPEPYTKANFVARRACRFLRENRDRPFMLFVNFLEPHMPFTSPFDDLHARDDLATGPHFLQTPEQSVSLLNQMLAESYGHREYEGCDLRTEAGWREIRARYFGLMTLVDRGVDLILRTLEDCGLADNTIIVFTSDHGDMMGDHRILAKCVMYEEAVKVPLLLRVPWLGHGHRRIPGRISQIDLLPTLLELVDAAVPEDVQGRSRADVVRGEATLNGNDVFVEWNGPDGRPKTPSLDGVPGDLAASVAFQPWRTIVSSDGWKLNLSPHDQCELYDLNDDPYEQTNRFDDANQRDRVKHLTDRIRAWQAETGDDVTLPAS